jgi:hypothetical protein
LKCNIKIYFPKINPKKAPKLQKMIECHSTLIFMKRMQKPAVTIPKINIKTDSNVFNRKYQKHLVASKSSLVVQIAT